MIRFAKPLFEPNTIGFIVDALPSLLESGHLTNSLHVRNVGEFFSSMLTRRVVATNSCTASLHLSILLLGVSKGNEVIVPSNTFASTANAVVYCNAKPVFAEVSPSTFNIDPDDIEIGITDRMKAIVVAHLAGRPCDTNYIRAIADEHNLALVEDCVHAHGSKYQGVPCGMISTYSAFSVYPTKVLPSAEGGLLVVPEEEREDIARLLVNQGKGVLARELLDSQLTVQSILAAVEKISVIRRLKQAKSRAALAAAVEAQIAAADDRFVSRRGPSQSHSHQIGLSVVWLS